MTFKKIRFVTDSTCDIPPEWIEKFRIGIVPAFVNYGGESYADASARVARAFEQGALPGEPGTLIVAHQALNRVLSRYLAGAAESAVLAMAQPSTVVLRFEGREVSHARIPEADAEPIAWEPGLFGSGKR